MKGKDTAQLSPRPRPAPDLSAPGHNDRAASTVVVPQVQLCHLLRLSCSPEQA